MSNIDKQALRERYSEKPAPKCHICGSVMTIQRAGAGGVVYGCTGRIDKDGEGYKFAEGRDLADDHYARSCVTVADESDPDVLALLDELEAMHKYAKERDAENEGLMLTVGRLRCDKEAAEKRIAELEEREVNLPKLSVGEVMHMSGFSRDYSEGWCSGNDNAIHEIHAAGVKVAAAAGKGDAS